MATSLHCRIMENGTSGWYWEEFAETAAEAKAEKQYGPAMTGLTAIAKLAGLWVDRAENINGNYAVSDKPLSEQEWVEQHTSKSCCAR
jgi:hypothetical protein